MIFWLLTLSMDFLPIRQLAFASASRTQRYPNGLLVVSASPHRPGYSSSECNVIEDSCSVFEDFFTTLLRRIISIGKDENFIKPFRIGLPSVHWPLVLVAELVQSKTVLPSSRPPS